MKYEFEKFLPFKAGWLLSDDSFLVSTQGLSPVFLFPGSVSSGLHSDVPSGMTMPFALFLSPEPSESVILNCLLISTRNNKAEITVIVFI